MTVSQNMEPEKHECNKKEKSGGRQGKQYALDGTVSSHSQIAGALAGTGTIGSAARGRTPAGSCLCCSW